MSQGPCNCCDELRMPPELTNPDCGYRIGPDGRIYLRIEGFVEGVRDDDDGGAVVFRLYNKVSGYVEYSINEDGDCIEDRHLIVDARRISFDEDGHPSGSIPIDGDESAFFGPMGGTELSHDEGIDLDAGYGLYIDGAGSFDLSPTNEAPSKLSFRPPISCYLKVNLFEIIDSTDTDIDPFIWPNDDNPANSPLCLPDPTKGLDQDENLIELDVPSSIAIIKNWAQVEDYDPEIKPGATNIYSRCSYYNGYPPPQSDDPDEPGC